MAYIKKTTPHGNKGKKQSPDTVAKRNEHIKKPIIAFDGETEYYFGSVSEAASALNVAQSQISILLRAEAKGYSFKYGSK